MSSNYKGMTCIFWLKSGVSLFQAFQVFRLFGAHLDHFWYQCKSDANFFFWGVGGRGIGVQWPKMTLECIICDPRCPKISGGGPQPPLKRERFLWDSFNKHLHTLRSSALYAFWSSARQTPVKMNPCTSFCNTRFDGKVDATKDPCEGRYVYCQ